VLLAAGLALAPAAAAEPWIRVLMLETDGPVRVGAVGERGALVAAAPGGLQVDGRPVASPWRLSAPLVHLDGLRLRGELQVGGSQHRVRVVNRVPIEAYVAGTLGRETYAGWPAEMLKAQAVAARTYALHQAHARRGEAWDLAADTSGQVYGGADAETPAVLEATRATRGQWLAWEGRPILAVYHSASGGRTASAEEVWGRALPYLRSVPVEGEEDSPDTYWRASIPGTTLGPALASLGVQVGPVRELEVVDRSESGRARSVRVRGRDGEGEVDAHELRKALGATVIRSTLFDTRVGPDGFVFFGSGHGHGVGMSQWGAQSMARQGAGYLQILRAFYPGAQLREGLP
jgi:stage II sporulation protein D